MRILLIIIFIGLFFTLYGLVNFYIFMRGVQAIPEGSTLRSAYSILFWIVACSFVVGRLLERVWPGMLSDTLVWLGSFWIAAMLYFFLVVLILDILRAFNHFFPFFPEAVTAQYVQVKYILAAFMIGVIAIVLLVGHINAIFPRIKHLQFTIHKRVEGVKSLNIVMASDIHLGTIVGRNRIDHIVEEINQLHPDVVLLPGDIVDEDLDPVIRQNIGESLRNLKARYGVFAVTGNHEYIGGVDRACRYLTEHNVVMLRDAVVKLNGDFYLVGREDRSFNRGQDVRRKPLGELMAQVDRGRPIILMDHQPFGLNEAVEQGVDLQLSGHTHHGQLWPVNYIIRMIFKLGWGYRQIGNTRFYVSNGVGTWGPPVRIGNRPEIVNIHLQFQ